MRAARAGLGLLLALAAACGAAQEGERRALVENWPGGGVRLECEEVRADGTWLKDGPAVFRDEGGRVTAQGAYRLGLETGPWREVYEDGTSGAGEYVDGQREGPWSYFHPGGERQEEGDYEGGQRVGTWTRWYASGKKESEVRWVEGERHGTATYWAPDGSVRERLEWREGERE